MCINKSAAIMCAINLIYTLQTARIHLFMVLTREEKLSMLIWHRFPWSDLFIYGWLVRHWNYVILGANIFDLNVCRGFLGFDGTQKISFFRRILLHNYDRNDNFTVRIIEDRVLSFSHIMRMFISFTWHSNSFRKQRISLFSISFFCRFIFRRHGKIHGKITQMRK